jgi:FkbM family methyltransferase
MRFLQIHTFYPQYIKFFYSRFKHLHHAPFCDQIAMLASDSFSAAHIIAPHMKFCGYEERLIIANCCEAQIQWLKENNERLQCSKNWVEEIALKQVENFQPDILYLSHPIEFDGRFLRRLKHKPKLVLGWRAATFPYNIDWTGFDVMLSSLKPLLDLAVQRGAKAGELFMPGFPQRIAAAMHGIKPNTDVTFCGQYTPQQHAKRGYYLREIARHASKKGLSCAFHLNAETLPDTLTPFAQPPVFGLEMHRALKSGRIVFDARANHFITAPDNTRIDIGGNNTANMRIFETTGSGAFLLTEHFPNISEYFEVGKEIETFSCRKELLEKIDHYLTHPLERQEIARRGQARCLKDHSMEQRTEWLNKIIQRHLKGKQDSATLKARSKTLANATSSCFPPEPVAQISSPAITPVVEGTLTEALNALKGMVASHPRRQPGHVVIEGIRFSFADLHSFYFELEQIFSKHIYGFHTQEDRPLIIDCGAHVGLATLYFARRYPQSIIHAFEADPNIHNLFRSNVQNSALDNVTSHAKAVWIHDDGVSFSISGDDSGHINPEEGTKIPSIRLKNFLEQFDRIEMLKLDVEGAEYEILKDCRSTLNRIRRMVIEVHHLSDEKQRLGGIFSVLEQAGFQYVASDLHAATWTKPGNTPPFDFISHDKFIMTVFAWQTKSLQDELNSTISKSSHHPKVAQFCMQDFGGAGTAAIRLHDGLLNFNIDSTFYVQNIRKWKPKTSTLSTHAHSIKTGIKFTSPEWNTFHKANHKALSDYIKRPIGLEMFSIPWSATKIDTQIEIAAADIIHLHWISGTLSISENIEFLKSKKIVWTLHDMNPFTGGCHYSGNCYGYENHCGRCPQLGSENINDLSYNIWKTKKSAYQLLDITVVSPSQWLAECAKKSSLLSSFPVHVIPNGLPTDAFKPYPQKQIRESLKVPESSFVILFGADSINNARKGFQYLLQALNVLKKEHKQDSIILAIFGSSNDIAKHLGYQTICFDYVEKNSELAMIYSMADVTVIPSLEDNLPNIVLESLACGTPVVGFNVGGIPDMVEHKSNGYLASVGDDTELAKGINWVMEQLKIGTNIRLKCRETALRMYNLPLQAKSYRELYARILK